MRLLEINTNGGLSLTKDLLDDSEVPSYAILSHTWQEGQEVTFDDFTNGTGNDKTGYGKIQFCAQQAARDGLRYFWVDTCCIDKKDNIELQNAINSMFRWYQGAAKCYVFLSDVSTAKRKASSESYHYTWEPEFRGSRWFTRGWTLQELLAPRTVIFFSREGNQLGDRHKLQQLIHEITNIPISALTGTSLDRFEVKTRLSWTENRNTTRKEDKAYSLLGIFGIYLPLLYGEGQDNAFRRLRKGIKDALEEEYNVPLLVNSHVATSPTLSDQELNCLRSLSYPEQEHRYNDVHVAKETCQWLLEHPQYLAWKNSTQGLFWVKGNPGTGKSVLMKHAVRNMQKKSSDEVIVSFFIHGQGTDLQKTPLGIFRALLNALLYKFPEYLAQLTASFEDREKRFGGHMADRWKWNCQELQELLFDVLTIGAKHQPVTIFVDALDECGEGPAKSLLAYFKDLMNNVEKQQAHVKICLSSRHYPVLGLDVVTAVNVEERNGEDIWWYVQERLKTIRPEPRRQQIESEILAKAQGGFQWVFLVTETIIDKNLAGIRAENLVQELTSCPQPLSQLYAAILSVGSEVERRQMLKLFRWVLFAERPLSTQELREAFATNADMNYTTVAELRSQESWSDTLVDFERHVKHISKGLVEFRSREIWEQYEVGEEDSDREAQLIHQSVADFLLDEFSKNTEDNRIGSAHFQISKSCLRYLSLKEVLKGAQLPRGALSSRFPLAPYATRFFFEHIKKAEQTGVPQPNLLPLVKWTPQSETTQTLVQLWRILDPNNVHTPVGWPFTKSTVFHILATFGWKSAFIACLDDHARDIDSRDIGGNTPLHVAVREGYQDIALILLHGSSEWYQQHKGSSDRNGGVTNIQRGWRVDVDAENDDGDTAFDLALMGQLDTVVLELIKAGARFNYRQSTSMMVLCAIKSRNSKLLSTLIEMRISLDGAVFFALECHSLEQDHIIEKTITELLTAGANTTRSGPASEAESSGEHFDNDALQLASRRGLTNVVNLLLSHGVSAVHQNSVGECPLLIAAEQGNRDIIQSLLNYKPSAVNLKDRRGRTALSIAFQNQRLDLLEVLLSEGNFSDSSPALSNVLLKSTETWSKDDHMIRPQAAENSELLTNLLLTKGRVDFNAKDEHSRSLFLYAAATGRKILVEQLLATQLVEINAKDLLGDSAIAVAAREGHAAIVELLLARAEIDPNSQNRDGCSPLVLAAGNGHKAVVELLLTTRRVDVNAKSKNGRSPLLEAAYYGHVAVVQLLLAKEGVKVDAESRDGRSLLLQAAYRGHTDVVQVLFAKEKANLNVDLLENGGRYLLLQAAYCGHADVAEFLLAKEKADLNVVDKGGRS